MKSCIFCGPTASPITKEHVWPQWISRLAQEAGVKGIRINQVETPFRGTRVDRTRHVKMFDIQARVVCKKCNNEDLSDLENKYAKAVLVPLLRGERSELSPEQQVILTAWITKMAMVQEFVTSGRKFFSQSEREAFLQTLVPPEGTLVWLADVRSSHLSTCSQHSLFLKSAPSDPLIFIFTVTIGRFSFQLFCRRKHNGARWKQRMLRNADRWRNAILPIHPLNDRDVSWPPPQHVNDRSLKAFADRFGGKSENY
jgi:hypothetical protein